MGEQSVSPQPPPRPWWRELLGAAALPAGLFLLVLVVLTVYFYARGGPVDPGDKIMVLGRPIAVAATEGDVDRLYEHVNAGDADGAAEMDAHGRCFLVRHTDALLVIRKDRHHCEVRFVESIQHKDDPNLGRLGYLPTYVVWQIHDDMQEAASDFKKSGKGG